MFRQRPVLYDMKSFADIICVIYGFFIQNYNDIICTLPMPSSLAFQKANRTVVETLRC